MIKECIILAGGFGTRLQTVVNDVPKPMAPVNNKPFLAYLFNYLQKYKIEHVVLSVGHLADKIESYFGNNYNNINISYAHENEPLGTGGGIFNALKKCNTQHVLVLNGDTFFDIELNAFYQFHIKNAAAVSLCLRKLDDTSRYGTVQLNEQGRIVSFVEKTQGSKNGNINGGVYLFNRDLTPKTMPEKFSIEKDLFEKQLGTLPLFGFVSSGYFIDIGIPEDYFKAQHELKAFENG